MDREAIIREANESLITRGEIDKVSQYFTSAYVAHEEGKDHEGHEFVERFLTVLRNAIPACIMGNYCSSIQCVVRGFEGFLSHL